MFSTAYPMSRTNSTKSSHLIILEIDHHGYRAKARRTYQALRQISIVPRVPLLQAALHILHSLLSPRFFPYLTLLRLLCLKKQLDYRWTVWTTSEDVLCLLIVLSLTSPT
ncbi:hypothetical protein Hanom_Chr11g01034461 [Helianthus anomalus]